MADILWQNLYTDRNRLIIDYLLKPMKHEWGNSITIFRVIQNSELRIQNSEFYLT